MDVDQPSPNNPSSIYSLVRYNNLAGLQSFVQRMEANFFYQPRLADLEFTFNWITDTSSYERWPKKCALCFTCRGIIFFGDPTTIAMMEEALALQERTGAHVIKECTCGNHKNHLDSCRLCGFGNKLELKPVGIERYCQIRGFKQMESWVQERLALEQMNNLSLSK